MTKYSVWIAAAAAAVCSLAAEPPPFLAPPGHVGPPRQPDHAVDNRAFQGIPSVAVSPGGRIWATWYAGPTPGEDQNNYVVLSTSGDRGETWREVLVVDPDGSGPVRAFDPEIWLGPDGRLRLFWAQAVGHVATVGGVWMVETGDPESADAAWGEPRRVADGVMMCKPLVLDTGEWVLPVSTWRQTDHSARMVVSTDGGATWDVRGACQVPPEDRSFDEHMFVERRDGSLWMLARTKYGIGESVSTDRGRTWPALAPSGIAHPSARFFIRRLDSGNLLLVKHGPIGERTGRSHLTAFLSRDDGKTWEGGLLLDERNGVSYPDGQQDADGTIWIAYDYSRTRARQIYLAAFREEDVVAGQDASGQLRLRILVSQGSGGRERPPPPVEANADGAPLRRETPGMLAGETVESAPFVLEAKLFADRGYTLAEVPGQLAGARFLPVPLDGVKTVRCTRPGTVYFLTPRAERNRDSQVQTLLDLGFEKVALPEVRLFHPARPANFCTLFQRDCQQGETFEFGKWAVPLYFP